MCRIFCGCDRIGLRGHCMHFVLADASWSIATLNPKTWRRTFDAYHPGLYVEVPFDAKHQPVMCVDCPPTQWGLPQPAGDMPPLPGTSRPDAILVKDPSKPPGPGNIARVYEFKFPGDTWNEETDQFGRYDRLAKAGGGELREISVDKCRGCIGYEPLFEEVPVPVPVPVPAAEPKRLVQPNEPEPEQQPEPSRVPSFERFVDSVGALVGLGMWVAHPAGRTAGLAAAALIGFNNSDSWQYKPPAA